MYHQGVYGFAHFYWDNFIVWSSFGVLCTLQIYSVDLASMKILLESNGFESNLSFRVWNTTTFYPCSHCQAIWLEQILDTTQTHAAYCSAFFSQICVCLGLSSRLATNEQFSFRIVKPCQFTAKNTWLKWPQVHGYCSFRVHWTGW